jgi:hypothetical protein
MAGVRAAAACLVVTAFVLFAAVPAWAAFGARYALVVGNSDYAHVEPLPNTARDAEAMAEALEALRFTVFKGIDLTGEEFERLIAEFDQAAAGADTVVFYYAGHGFQLNGLNHLAPVDAVLRDRSRIYDETLVLDNVIERIHRRKRQTIVFLDACRNNPLPPGTENDVRQGLAQVGTGDGTFIAFATQPGNVSYDGSGKNSPFTEALLTHIGKPGRSISQLMIEVRNDVSDRTVGRQVPWDQSSLRADFSFNPTPDYLALSEPSRGGIVIGAGGGSAVQDTGDGEDTGLETSPAPRAATPISIGPRPVQDPADVRPTTAPTRPDTATAAVTPRPKPDTVTAAATARAQPDTVTAAATARSQPDTTTAATTARAQPDTTTAATIARAQPDTVTAAATARTQPDTSTAATTARAQPDTVTAKATARAQPDTITATATARTQPDTVTSKATARTQPDTVTAMAAARAQPDTLTAMATTRARPDMTTAAATVPVRADAITPAATPTTVERLKPAREWFPDDVAPSSDEAVDEERQIAALDPQEPLVSEPPRRPSEPLVDAQELARSIQSDLARLGCYRLSVDGVWGPGSRSSLEQYYREKGETAPSLEPSTEILAALQGESGTICPPPKPSQPKAPQVAAPTQKKAPPAMAQPQRPAAAATQSQPAATPKKPRILGF